MKRTAIVLILALAALLVVAGCSTQAQSDNSGNGYYVPAAQGCGVAGVPVEQANVQTLVDVTEIQHTF